MLCELCPLCMLLTWAAHALQTMCVCVHERDTKRGQSLDYKSTGEWYNKVVLIRVCILLFRSFCFGVIWLCVLEPSLILLCTFFARESLSCWQLSTCWLRGLVSRVTWSTRSSFSSNCLSCSARFTSSYMCVHTDTMITVLQCRLKKGFAHLSWCCRVPAQFS